MSSALLVKRKLASVIKSFKFEELEGTVMSIFPEISWTRVKSKLIKNHKNFTVANVICIIEEILDNVDLTEKDLRDRLAMLQILDVSRHNKRKIWYGYKLTDTLNETLKYTEPGEIQEKIKNEFYTNGIKTDVKVVMYDKITFIYVREIKLKKKRTEVITPTFFALFLGHEHFFCSRKKMPFDYINVIAVSLGYNNSRRIKLMGKDLKSLMKLLWIKQQGVSHAENINQSLVYQPSDPVISNNGVDYLQSKQRKKYAEQCFGKDPPTIEKFVIKGPEKSIQHDIIVSKLSNDTICMNWEFRSHNIIKFLTALVEKRAFMPPLPNYVSDFMIRGRNELTCRTDW